MRALAWTLDSNAMIIAARRDVLTCWLARYAACRRQSDDRDPSTKRSSRDHERSCTGKRATATSGLARCRKAASLLRLVYALPSFCILWKKAPVQSGSSSLRGRLRASPAACRYISISFVFATSSGMRGCGSEPSLTPPASIPSSCADRLAPYWHSRRTISSSPSLAAQCSGVCPRRSRAWTSSGVASRIAMTLKLAWFYSRFPRPNSSATWWTLRSNTATCNADAPFRTHKHTSQEEWT